MNKGVTLAIGMAVGARLMYLLDPDRGRRHRAAGLMAETRARFRKRAVSDPVLVERVRAKIGRVVSHPRAIVVTADQGHVTLSGPILAGEVDDLLSAAAAVRGVQ